MRIPFLEYRGAKSRPAAAIEAPWEAIGPWIALAAIVLLAAGLRFSNLAALGDVNHYYTAAIRSMLQSWHNFFFVAAEPGGSVSVDKPPLGLWIQAASAAVFGVNTLGVLLPELLAGILAVVVVYHLVRRSFGAAAGLLAALALAITPVAVATDRNNTIDSLLILTLLLAAWAFIKATETRRLGTLLLAAVLVGLAFNIKMLQAYLPLPAFIALYFLGAQESVAKKIAKLGLGMAVLLAVSLSWVTVVDLTPADQRPYVGSSGDNSEMSLIIGYNGLERLLGMGRSRSGGFPSRAGGPPPGNNFFNPGGGFPGQPNRGFGGIVRAGPATGINGTGQPGLLRLVTGPLSKEASWLLPFGLLGLLLSLFGGRLAWPLSAQQQAGVLWGGWLIVGAGFFSVAGFFHEYYLAMIAAPLAALVGIGAVELWRKFRNNFWPAFISLAAAGAVTLWLQFHTARLFIQAAPWEMGVVALFGVGAAAVLAAGIFKHRAALQGGFGLVLAAMLVTPGIWSGLTDLYPNVNQSLPAAYDGSTRTPVDGGGLQVNQSLLDYLQINTQGVYYLMAVPSSMQGADYALATGRPVLYMGGFMGIDQVVTASDLEKLVDEGKLRFIYWNSSGAGFGNQGSLTRWIESRCKMVPGFDTATLNAGNPDGTGGAPGGMGGAGGPGIGFGGRGGTQISLYDCWQ